jgi:hypothetical protein
VILNIYEVQARGIYGNIFTYHIGAPSVTPELEIACKAYAEHGKDLKEGKLRNAAGRWMGNSEEWLGPDYTVRLIDSYECPVTGNV